MGKSKIIKTKDNIKFSMATLDEIVNLNCLPTGYHTAHLPLLDSCDHCRIPIRYLTGKTYICGHSYHDKYYNIHNGCKHCLEYYKKGITKQAKAFKKGLEKIEDEKDILNNEESNENDDNNLNEEENNNKTEDIDNKLQIAINTIDQ
ncbi:10893_t:CDS:1 [Racocetra persica]|uniref:10893_t:CDS:1 n=1 Tax=Racocetra persica TaxID=160502 RepID=A0ACA9RHC6_9GLOM|nr:10893_t:CDS:1 [Racocetra persica]